MAGEATVNVAPAGRRWSAARRAAWLRREIRRHDRLYYEQARPEISDAAYDRLKPAIAESVAEFFAEPANREMCRRLTEAGVRTTHRTTPHGTRLAGNTLVLTGALHALTRDQAAERIGERGGRVGATVTPATDYVVVGADPGTKLARARALGVPTLDERAFLARPGK
jgi:DNA ligase (NAD+)